MLRRSASALSCLGLCADRLDQSYLRLGQLAGPMESAHPYVTTNRGDVIRRTRTEPCIAAGPRASIHQPADADSGAGHPRPAEGSRRPGPGTHRLGQDARLLAPARAACRPPQAGRPGAGAGTDPRAGHPGWLGAGANSPGVRLTPHPALRWACLWTRATRGPRRADRHRHPWQDAGPPTPGHAVAGAPVVVRARRGRRDARSRFCAGRRAHPWPRPTPAPDRAVLRNAAAVGGEDRGAARPRARHHPG